MAEGLGITAESLRTWRRQFSGVNAATANETLCKLPTATADAEELRVEVRRLRAQLQSVTNPRDILKRSRRDFRRPKRERFAMIEALEETYPVRDLCAAFGVSRAGFSMPGVNAAPARGTG